MFRVINQLSKGFTFSHMSKSLSETDPEVYHIIINEKNRQNKEINLTASENYCSNASLFAVGSIFNDKYAQGYPGARYYAGIDETDKLQSLCFERALKAFNLDDKKWGVNVQTLSGNSINLSVYTALLNTYDRVLSLNLSHSGHSRMSALPHYFEVFPYTINDHTGIVDYDDLRKTALIYRPKIVQIEYSSSQFLNTKRIKQICDEIDAYLVCNVSHLGGLIANSVTSSPFEYADVVTMTPNKTLRGTRGAIIISRTGPITGKKGKDSKLDIKTRIDKAVFPGLQAGPHIHTIAGITVSLGQVSTPQFKQYQNQVLKNRKAAFEALMDKGYNIVPSGTEDHCFSIDLTQKGTNGTIFQAIASQICLAISKQSIPSDKGSLFSSGITIGVPAMTTRGCKETDFIEMMKFIDREVQIIKDISKKVKGGNFQYFRDILRDDSENFDVVKLRKDINSFALQFPIPGGNI